MPLWAQSVRQSALVLSSDRCGMSSRRVCVQQQALAHLFWRLC
jgi:hypothetical protein